MGGEFLNKSCNVVLCSYRLHTMPLETNQCIQDTHVLRFDFNIRPFSKTTNSLLGAGMLEPKRATRATELTHTHTQFNISNSPMPHVFELWGKPTKTQGEQKLHTESPLD